MVTASVADRPAPKTNATDDTFTGSRHPTAAEDVTSLLHAVLADEAVISWSMITVLDEVDAYRNSAPLSIL